MVLSDVYSWWLVKIAMLLFGESKMRTQSEQIDIVIICVVCLFPTLLKPKGSVQLIT